MFKAFPDINSSEESLRVAFGKLLDILRFGGIIGRERNLEIVLLRACMTARDLGGSLLDVSLAESNRFNSTTASHVVISILIRIFVF